MEQISTWAKHAAKWKISHHESNSFQINYILLLQVFRHFSWQQNVKIMNGGKSKSKYFFQYYFGWSISIRKYIHPLVLWPVNRYFGFQTWLKLLHISSKHSNIAKEQYSEVRLRKRWRFSVMISETVRIPKKNSDCLSQILYGCIAQAPEYPISSFWYWNGEIVAKVFKNIPSFVSK